MLRVFTPPCQHQRPIVYMGNNIPYFGRNSGGLTVFSRTDACNISHTVKSGRISGFHARMCTQNAKYGNQYSILLACFRISFWFKFSDALPVQPYNNLLIHCISKKKDYFQSETSMFVSTALQREFHLYPEPQDIRQAAVSAHTAALLFCLTTNVLQWEPVNSVDVKSV